MQLLQFGQIKSTRTVKRKALHELKLSKNTKLAQVLKHRKKKVSAVRELHQMWPMQRY